MKANCYCMIVGAIFLAAGLSLTAGSRAAEIRSPSGDITVDVSVVDGSASYSIQHNGRPVLRRSPLGLLGKDGDLPQGVTLIGEEQGVIDETFPMHVGKTSSIRNHGNWVVLSLRCGEREYDVEFRAYDDGVAFAYFLNGEGDVTLTGETTGFRFPESTNCWLQPRVPKRSDSISYEDEYLPFPVGSVPSEAYQGPKGRAVGWNFPAMFQVNDTYVLVSESGVTANYCAAHLADDCRGLYKIAFPAMNECKGNGHNAAVATLPFRTAWRVIMLGDLAEVATSNLVFKVADPLHEKCNGEIPDWVRPGKSVWDWWVYWTGGPVRQRRYIDAAADFGWDYILIDAKWDRWQDPYGEIKRLVDYGRTKDIGILLWYNSGGRHTWSRMVTPIDKMEDRDIRRKEMKKLQAIGVAGLKIDFFEGDKQDRIKQYLGILEEALDSHLMINFHGCTVPRGWERRFPNLMTMEAVRGAEAYPKHPKEGSYGPPAIHSVRLTMTRNVVGSMDFTPVMFSYRCVTDRPESQDYSFTLATAIAFESAITHYPDAADHARKGYRRVFADYPAVGHLMRDLPTTWDETRLLSGDMDSHCLWARRKGDRWYLGGLNGKTNESQELSTPCSFLGDGEYDMVRIESAGKRALRVSEGVVRRTDTMTAELPIGGGLSITLTPRH